MTVAALTSMQPLRDCFCTVVKAMTTATQITASSPSTDPMSHRSRRLRPGRWGAWSPCPGGKMSIVAVYERPAD